MDKYYQHCFHDAFTIGVVEEEELAVDEKTNQ